MLHLSATVGVSVMNLSAKLTQQGGRAPGDSEPIIVLLGCGCRSKGSEWVMHLS